MQKIFSTIVSLVLGFGMIGGITPVHAEEMVAPATPALRAEEAALLKQTLDVLGVMLVQIQTGITSSDSVAANASMFAAVLTGIKTQLVALDATLKGEPIAAAAAPAPTPTPVEVTLEVPPSPVAVAPQPALEAEHAPATEEPVAIAPTPTLEIESDDSLAANSPLAAKAEEDTNAEASVGSILGGKAPIGIAIAAVVVLGVGLYLWLKRDNDEELEVEPVRQKAVMVQKPLSNDFDRRIADSSIDL